MDSQLYEQQLQQEGLPFGRYRLLAKLAVGGMAELFLARQKGVGGFSKTVVIKCVLPYLAQDQDFVAMFLSEARLAAHLNHSNVVQIFDIGCIDGIYYMAMEYIAGQNLREITRKLYRQLGDEAPPPYAELASIFAQAAAGLDYVHKAKDDNHQPLQLVHRDISPNNIVVSYDGQVKIVDFGVAKARNQERQTEVGVLKGRLSYMSPEQVSGFDLDGRSDIYSLGIVLYELTTNRRLFRRKSEPETIQALLHGPVPSPTHFYPDYPPELEAILMKMLERSPDARYQTASEVQTDLLKFLASQQKFLGAQDISTLLVDLFEEEKGNAESGTFEQPITTQDLINLSRGSYRVIQDASLQHAYSGNVSLPPGYVASTPPGAWPAGTGQFHPGAPSPPGPVPLSPNASVILGPQQPAITAPYAPPFEAPSYTPDDQDDPTIAGTLSSEGLSPSPTPEEEVEEATTVLTSESSVPEPSVPEPLVGEDSFTDHRPSTLSHSSESSSSGKGWVWVVVLLLLASGGVAGAVSMGWIQIRVGQDSSESGAPDTRKAVKSQTVDRSTARNLHLRRQPAERKKKLAASPGHPELRIAPRLNPVLVRKVQPRKVVKLAPVQKRKARKIRKVTFRRKRVRRRVRRRRTVLAARGAVLPFSKARLAKRVKVRVFRRGDDGREFGSELPRLCRKIEREVSRLLRGRYRVHGITKRWQAYVKKRFSKGRRYKYVFYPRGAAYVIYSQLLKGKSYGRIANTLASYQRNYRFRRYSNR